MPPPSAIQHVLVLDDDQTMRDLLEALLSLEGYRVTLTESGEQALAALGADATFDLVLTDLHMPGISGETLVAALRDRMPSHALLIGVSASPAEASAAGHLDAFLLKPFDPQTLQHAIESAANDRATRTSRPAPASAPEPAAELEPSAELPSSAVLDEAIVVSLARIIPVPQLRALYELTIGDVEKRQERMQASANEDDLEAVRREAHAMKGSCGMVGATELQSLAASLEGGTTLNTFALAQIPAACLRLRRMLDAKLQTV